MLRRSILILKKFCLLNFAKWAKIEAGLHIRAVPCATDGLTGNVRQGMSDVRTAELIRGVSAVMQ